MPTQQSRFTQLQLRDRVRGDLGARAASGGYITDADIDGWANEASDIIASETKWYRLAEQALSVTANVAEYDLPAELLALEEVRFNLRRIWPISIENLYKANPSWQQNAGTPYLYYFRGSTSIGLFPKPSATSATACKIDYAANAPLPALTSDKYNIPLRADEVLLAYCCYRGSVKDITAEGKQRVPIYQQEWERGLEKLRALYFDRNEGETLIGGGDARFGGGGDFGLFNPDAVIA